MTGGTAGVGVSSGLLARLSPYQVGLCSLLLQYAQEGLHRSKASERRMLELLLREVQKSEGPRHKALVVLRSDLCAEVDGGALWDALISRLREIDSPDALFETFHGLGAAIARDFAAPAALHGSGVFGHFARRCVLAFKDASFEASVKLFDAVREYVEAYDEQSRAAQDSIRTGSKVEGADAAGLGAAAPDQLALGATQLEELARGLMHDLPLSFGRVPFPVVDKALAALQGKLPLCHVVHFLRYVNSLQHRLADDAGSCLRSFHDGHQQRGLAEMRTASGWSLGVPSEDGLPDLIQYASLALAGLHSEMRHLDDALQAIGESIRAAQEASDGGCLCACLYMLSLVLLQAGHTGKAFAMMRRCLHRAESLGLPMIQSLCCLGIARTLSVQPSLSDRRQRGLLWKESISRMPGDVQPAAVLRVHGSAGGGAGGAGGAWSGAAGAAGGAARIFGYAGNAGGLGSARGGGLGVLAALLGQTQQEEEGAGAAGGGRGGQGGDANEGAACRDALAHVTLASQLSTWAGPASEARPKVLLCQAEVARVFGLRPLTVASCRTALDIYHQELATEDRAIALCQLAAAASEHSLAEARPLLRGVAQELPHASHLWAHIVGPRVIHALTRAGESSAASALLFQAAGLVRAVPHDAAASAAQQLRLAVNGVRLYNGHLLSAYRSARDAVESGAARSGNPGDVCSHLLCLVDVHLEAQDPIGALGPCLRCISAAENCRLLHFRAEALVRLARIKLEMRDLVGALQLAEEVTPQLAASGSARLRGEALMVQADVLFAAIARHQDDSAIQTQLLREIEIILRGAAAAFEAVAELNALRRCHYLLARAQHQLGDAAARDRHAACFRRVSEYLEGKRSSWWEDGASPFDVAEQATAEGAVEKGPTARCPALAELISMAAGARPGDAAALRGDGRPLAAGQREEGTATVVGATRALYPLTAVLGA